MTRTKISKQAVSVLAITAIWIVYWTVTTFANLTPVTTRDVIINTSNRFYKSGKHGAYLTVNDFKNSEAVFHDGNSKTRFESVESWRSADALKDTNNINKLNRPQAASYNEYKSMGDYLQQPIVADYTKGSEKIFFMIKTGGSELWKRLPMHIYTSLPKMPKFALYSDAPGSIAGYEVVDSLANVTQQTYESELFEMYRLQRELHDNHGLVDYSFSTLNKGWELDKFKNIPILKHGYEQCPDCDWFFMMDADTHVMVDNLVAWVKDKDPNSAAGYYGSPAGGIPGFAHGGSGILVSRKVAQLSVGELSKEDQAFWENRAMNDCCGDAVLAQLIEQKTGSYVITGEPSIGRNTRENLPMQGNSYWDLEARQENWCTRLITFHHIDEHDKEILWEYERLKKPTKNGKITYGDIYRDFYQPYISEKVEHWDNNARDINFSKDSTPDEDAWHSFDNCRNRCESDFSCLSFRYLPKANYCGLARSARLGRPTHKHLPSKKGPDDDGRDSLGAQSGWMIERLRVIRKNSGCDPVDHESPEKAEGWYWKRQYESGRFPGLTQ